MRILISLLFLLIPLLTLGQQVSPSDTSILYTGRIDFRTVDEAIYSLNGVSTKIHFEGKSVIGQFSATQNSYLYVIVDANDNPEDRKVIEIRGSAKQTIELASFDRVGEHTLEIIKLDESGSKVSFYGLDIEEGGLISKPERPTLQLEFIGDSNTAGWNAWNAYDNGGSEVSGAYHTFPGMVSRMLGAEYSLIGASGSGITDKASWNCRRVWDRLHLTETTGPDNIWDFENNYWGFNPSAVIVNLGANDYYGGASKEEIKNGWKSFILDQLRQKYPDAHIVLANSYGWAINEPADYVNEAIEELKISGETNVSFIRFPWLWGQQHAVVNEHAGFANLLAQHLSEVLDIEEPTPLPLSSFSEAGSIKNGSFETSTLSSIPDGWRPQGRIELIINPGEAFEGDRYLACTNGGLASFSSSPIIGGQLVVSGHIKALRDSHSGYIKLLFKNQGQATISSKQIEPDFTENWSEFSLSATVPQGTWSVWLVLESEEGSTVHFDDIQMSSGEVLSIDQPEKDSLKLFPNPAQNQLVIQSKVNKQVYIYNINGEEAMRAKTNSPIDISHLPPGLYLITDPKSNITKRFIKN